MGPGRVATRFTWVESARPFVLQSASPWLAPRRVDVLSHSRDAEFALSAGITHTLDLELALGLAASREGAGAHQVTNPTAPPLSAQGSRDPRLGVAWVAPSSTSWRQGARLQLTLPLGDEAALASAQVPVWEPTVSVSHSGLVDVAAMAGARLRSSTRWQGLRWGTQGLLGLAALRDLGAGYTTSLELIASPVLVSQPGRRARPLPAEALAALEFAPPSTPHLAARVALSLGLPLSAERDALTAEDHYGVSPTTAAWRLLLALRTTR